MSKTKKAKRILFITSQPFFEWRGSPIRLGFDILALAQLGYEVDFLTLPIGQRRTVEGVNILRAPNLFFAKSIAIGPSVLKLAFDVVLFFMGLSLILRHRYSVIHGVEDTGILALILGRLSRAKVVFEKHSDPASHRKSGLKNLILKGYTAVEHFVIRHADAIIGTGPGLVDQARKVKPTCNAHHICDIPSSLTDATPHAVEKTRKELQKNSDEQLILYVGSFAVYQGIDLLFDSIPLVLNKSPNARFLIIGGTPQEIEQRTTQLGPHAKRVTFLGKINPDELPNFLTASDILLSPRIAGINTPLKLLDYLKANRAIVATRQTANQLILDNSIAKLAAPTPADFSDAITQLLDNPDARQALAQKGHQHYLANYTFDHFRDNLKNCYDSL